MNVEQISIYLDVLKQTTFAIIPLAIVFFVYELILIKLPITKKLSILFGLVVTFVGLYMFLFSIEFGITEMGTYIFYGCTSLKTVSLSNLII